MTLRELERKFNKGTATMKDVDTFITEIETKTRRGSMIFNKKLREGLGLFVTV